ERALGAAEAAIDRKAAGDVRGVAVEFATGIDQQQVAVAQAGIVAPVVQHAAVAAGGDDRAIGWRLRALAPDFIEQFGFALVLEAARRAREHGATMGGRRYSSGAAHGVEFEFVLAQAHFVEDREQVDRAGRRTDAGASLGPDFAEPEPDPGIEHLVGAQRMEQGSAVGEQPGHLLVETADRQGAIDAEMFGGGLRPVAKAVPGLAFLVLLAAEEDRFGAIGVGDDHQHGLGFGKAGEVMEVAVPAIGIVAVAITHALGRGRQDGDPAPGRAHRLDDRLAAGRPLACARCRRRCCGCVRHGVDHCALIPDRVPNSASSWASRAGVPTSVQRPAWSWAPARPCSAAARNSGASGARVPGAMPAKSAGAYMPMPAKVNWSGARASSRSPSIPKSPAALWAGLATSTHQASRSDARIRAAMPHASRKSKSQKMSPLTTRKGASPSKGKAVAMPPAVSSALASGE